MEHVLVFAGVVDGHALGQARHDLAVEPSTNFSDKPAKVAVVDVGLNEDPQAAVLAGDFTGADGAPNLGDLTERNLFARGGGHERITKPFEIVALASFEAHLNRETLTAFNGRTDIAAAEAGQVYRQTVNVTPTAEGVLLVGVSVSVKNDEVTDVKAFYIPVIADN